MVKFIAGASALAMLLQVFEQFWPATRAVLPLGNSGFEQTAGLILGAIAISVIIDLFRNLRDKGSDDDEDDSDGFGGMVL